MVSWNGTHGAISEDWEMSSTPYNFECYRTLMERVFAGMDATLTVTMKSRFEGWSGRATETWEQRFFVEYTCYTSSGNQSTYKADSPYLEEACRKIMAEVNAK